MRQFLFHAFFFGRFAPHKKNEKKKDMGGAKRRSRKLKAVHDSEKPSPIAKSRPETVWKRPKAVRKRPKAVRKPSESRPKTSESRPNNQE